MINAEIRERERDALLLRARHAEARRLLTVTQRRVEYDRPLCSPVLMRRAPLQRYTWPTSSRSSLPLSSAGSPSSTRRSCRH